MGHWLSQELFHLEIGRLQVAEINLIRAPSVPKLVLTSCFARLVAALPATRRKGPHPLVSGPPFCSEFFIQSSVDLYGFRLARLSRHQGVAGDSQAALLVLAFRAG